MPAYLSRGRGRERDHDAYLDPALVPDPSPAYRTVCAAARKRRDALEAAYAWVPRVPQHLLDAMEAAREEHLRALKEIGWAWRERKATGLELSLAHEDPQF